MAKPDTSFKVRMPPDLKARVEEAARTSGRSINAEIVQRLERAYRPAILNLEEFGGALAGSNEMFRHADLALGIVENWERIRSEQLAPEVRLGEPILSTLEVLRPAVANHPILGESYAEIAALRKERGDS